uniref:Importin N-terminal domain-containing protein n=1 Tax=Emiliania huxleyi (strain CCMP1516) TaxID=280463 RepID=A0A0D3KAR0_EMIH1
MEQFKKSPSAATSVLTLLTADGQPPHLKQAAAVFFKNMCKRHWDAEASEVTIGEDVKQQVRDNLLSLFLVVPESIQAQLSEAISIIASHDFPERWQALLPALVQQ